MPEIGTSGSMSGDGKRSAAAWPKLPRPSSTLPKTTSEPVRHMSAIRGNPDVTQTCLDDRFWPYSDIGPHAAKRRQLDSERFRSAPRTG
jgi:hypothetical protein